MNLDELLKEAQNGNMVAQYNLAEYYGRRLKDITDEDEIYRCSREAMLWLKKSARQGYGPAMDAVNELNIRPDDDQPMDDLLNAESIAKPEPEPIPEPEPEPVPEPRPEPKPEVKQEPKQKPRPEPVKEPKPAVEPARKQETRRIPLVAEPKSTAEQFRSAPAEPAKEEKKGAFSSTSNAILCIILLISLILNVVLLIFISRLSKDSGGNQSSTKTPTVSAEPTAASTAKPTEQPHGTPAPTPEATPEPVTTPEPDDDGFWLDLSKYPKLSVVPSESDLYSDYVYYVVTASDSLNMRSGPGTAYDILGSIPAAGKVGAVSKSNGWYLVNYNGTYGWVAGNYLTDNLNYRPSSSSSNSNSSSGNLKTW